MTVVAKMASHAIFQYNILAINDTHNTWTNMIVKMTILRLLGSSDDKEKIGVARKWMHGSRSTSVCIQGLDSFLKAAMANRSPKDLMCCPCSVCENKKKFQKKILYGITWP